MEELPDSAISSTTDIYTLNELICDGDTNRILRFIEDRQLTHEAFVSRQSTGQPYYPVLLAASLGKVYALNALISVGFKPNALFPWEQHRHMTPLHVACQKGHLAVVQSLIWDHKVCLNDADYGPCTPVFTAFVNNYFHIVRFLVEEGAQLNRAQGSSTLLHEATTRKQANMCRYLIEHGADVNIKNNWNKTPLFNAVMAQDQTTLTTLIDCGADVNSRGGFDETALFAACIKDDVKAMEYLVGHGAHPQHQDKCGNTPLHYAVGKGLLKVCMYLILDLNVDLETCNHDNQTALSRTMCGSKTINLGNPFYFPEPDATVFANTVRFLIKCGARLPDDILLLRDTDILKDLQHVISSPRSLCDICCFQIRRMLGRNLDRALKCLPLPKQIKTFLKLSHLKTA